MSFESRESKNFVIPVFPPYFASLTDNDSVAGYPDSVVPQPIKFCVAFLPNGSTASPQ